MPRTPGNALPDAIRRVAGHAESVGFDSLWVEDRLLSPLATGRSDAFPDPIGALHIAATSTTTMRLAVAIVAPWHPAVLLGRALTTLDLASEGRLTVALTTGCSVDEYDAAGSSVDGRATRLEETLDVLDATWRGSVVAYEGSNVRIPPSIIEPKPVQRPRPPILLGGNTAAALDRVARRGDGWLAAFPSIDVVEAWSAVQTRAKDHGRDPASLRLVVHLDLGGPAHWCSDGLIDGGIRAARESGAHELVVGLPGDDVVADDRLECLAAVSERVRSS